MASKYVIIRVIISSIVIDSYSVSLPCHASPAMTSTYIQSPIFCKKDDPFKIVILYQCYDHDFIEVHHTLDIHTGEGHGRGKKSQQKVFVIGKDLGCLTHQCGQVEFIIRQVRRGSSLSSTPPPGNHDVRQGEKDWSSRWIACCKFSQIARLLVSKGLKTLTHSRVR